MGVSEELADLRAAVTHLLRFGQPKSETDANALIDQMHSNVKDEQKPPDLQSEETRQKQAEQAQAQAAKEGQS